jgi:hypothetical protein
MKQELDRIKGDVETMQKAMGLGPSMARDWIHWLKRDRWFSLWWCLPGAIIIAAALLPLDHAARHFGLVPDQWAGILVAITLFGLAIGHSRRVSGKDGRPEAMVRELKRTAGMTGEGFWFSVALVVQLALYVIWCWQHHLPFSALWTGFFMLTGSTCLAGALIARAWILLGYALPFLAYGLCLPLADGSPTTGKVLFGIMFIAVALSFSFIQAMQIRHAQSLNESH